MNVYYVKRFQAIIVAPDRIAAFDYLAHELKPATYLDHRDINPNEFIQLDTRFAHTVLLNDNEII